MYILARIDWHKLQQALRGCSRAAMCSAGGGFLPLGILPLDKLRLV